MINKICLNQTHPYTLLISIQYQSPVIQILVRMVVLACKVLERNSRASVKMDTWGAYVMQVSTLYCALYGAAKSSNDVIYYSSLLKHNSII